MEPYWTFLIVMRLLQKLKIMFPGKVLYCQKMIVTANKLLVMQFYPGINLLNGKHNSSLRWGDRLHIMWFTSLLDQRGMQHLVYSNEYIAFKLFIPPPIENIILDNSNAEGKRVFGKKWTNLDDIDFDAYVGLLLLAGIYMSHKESRHEEKWKPIFKATMSLQKFKMISSVIRFDDRDILLMIPALNSGGWWTL